MDDLYVDTQTYGRHPDCQFLVLVIIDAAKYLLDPYAVETDLSGVQMIDGRSIRVIAYVREP